MTKHEILDVIRRTAAANGGVPLGEDRLTKLGITQATWARFWPRLSAAQREAGLIPNTRNEAVADDEVFAKLAAFVRALGAFPTSRERVLRRREDPTFPSDRVFKRLGPTSRLVAGLVEYARNNVGNDDVVAICGAHLDAAFVPTTATSPASLGSVYLLKGQGAKYKIGRTNAFGRRARELKIQLPFETKKIHIIATDDPEGVEAYWHRRFEAKRINSEWFELEPADVAAFKRWKRIA